MRRIFLIVLSALLTSCNSVQPSLISFSLFADPTATPVPFNTPTLGIPSVTSSPEIPTATPTPDCDPSSTFCILDGHFFFQRPISPPGRVTADNSYLFGTTEYGAHEPHHGIDLSNATGTPVLAVADGTVVFAGSDSKNPVGPYTDFYGSVVIIQHSIDGMQQPVYSLYGHLSEVDVVLGQMVQAGELIGRVGSTGIAMGSHLHFEARLGENTYDNSINPALWLIPLDGKGVIAGRVADTHGNMLYLTNIRLQFYPADKVQPNFAMQVETYAPEEDHVRSDANLQENFAIGDLTAGKYRIAFEAGGLYDRWVDVQSGKLTYVEFVVK